MKNAIIYVDDDPDQLFLYKTVSHHCKLPYPVETVTTGKALFALLDGLALPPIVIFLDIFLPEQDGFQILAAIRSSPRYQHIPVIMLSVAEDSGTVERAYLAGANAYLVKPSNGAEAMITMMQQIRAYWLTYNLSINQLESWTYW